jgi:hypothetical protein
VLEPRRAALKRTVAQARLVVVHSQEIDSAGEKGVGPTGLRQVHAALRAPGACCATRACGAS